MIRLYHPMGFDSRCTASDLDVLMASSGPASCEEQAERLSKTDAIQAYRPVPIGGKSCPTR